MRQRFRHQLRAKEFAFFFAQSGEEALTLLELNSTIDMVLLELQLPHMDGLTLLRHLSDQYPWIKAVVVSSYGDMANIRHAMNCGAFDFITKPVDLKDLDLTISRTLAHVCMLRKSSQAHDQLILINRELELAGALQRSITPQAFPQNNQIYLDGLMIPAVEVGGDFYDYFYLDNDRLGLVITDVSGKGITAGWFMIMSRTYLRAIAPYCKTPVEALRKLNVFLCQENAASMFVTLFYGIFDCKTAEMRYASGGHCQPLLIDTSKEIRILPVIEGMGLGIDPSCLFEEASTILAPGETLILYTDGISEAMNPKNEEYSVGRLILTLSKHAALNPTEMIQELKKDLTLFVSNAKQSDDITMLALKYFGNN